VGQPVLNRRVYPICLVCNTVECFLGGMHKNALRFMHKNIIVEVLKTPYENTLGVSPVRTLVLIRDTDCLVCNLLEEGSVRGVFRYLKCGEARSTHVLQVTASGRRGFSGRLRLCGASIYRLAGGLMLIESPSCTACRIFNSSPCVPRQGIYIPGVGMFFTLLTPSLRVLRSIIDRLSLSGKMVEVVERRGLTIPRALSDRQLMVLIIAMRMGYLNTPRECSLSEMADALGLSKSTIYRCLKSALKKLALDALIHYDEMSTRGPAT